jgi:hypothetical protein
LARLAASRRTGAAIIHWNINLPPSVLATAGGFSMFGIARNIMYPFLPAECFSGAAEFACYVFAAVTALVSYCVTCRF